LRGEYTIAAEQVRIEVVLARRTTVRLTKLLVLEQHKVATPRDDICSTQLNQLDLNFPGKPQDRTETLRLNLSGNSSAFRRSCRIWDGACRISWDELSARFQVSTLQLAENNKTAAPGLTFRSAEGSRPKVATKMLRTHVHFAPHGERGQSRSKQARIN
jgi:hypothetical protein